MNKNELSVLLTRCPNDSSLFDVAREAVRRLNSTNEVRIVQGERQPREDLLRIYTARLQRKAEKGQSVTGLKETVEAFEKCQSSLGGGYAETGAGVIYFWTDEAGNLAGCVL